MEITIPALLGVAGSFVAALINRSTWSSQAKRLVVLAVYAVATLAVLAAQTFPETWQAVASALAVVVASGQIAFTALKPSGLYGWLEAIGAGTQPPEEERRGKHEL